MDVIIVSKTKMGSTGVCIGGITLPNLSSVRLLNKDGSYHTTSTDFEINQIWDIDFKVSPNIANPHNEDVFMQTKKLLSKKFTDYNWLIKQKQLKNIVWKGSVKEIFDKQARWTGNRNGYISKPNVPKTSTGFWIPDKDLSYKDKHYSYKSSGIVKQSHNLKYVGFQKPLELIPAGSIVRVSLAKWWKPENVDMELRCYLQLSGWYT